MNSAQAFGAEAASTFVDTLADQVMSAVDVGGPNGRGEAAQLLNQNVALHLMGSASLGRHGEKFDESARSAYVNAFEGYIVEVLTSLLSEFAGGAIEITGTRTLPGGDELVTSTVTIRGNTTAFSWRVRGIESGDNRIIDVVADGTSAVATMRDDFDDLLRSANGNAQALVLALGQYESGYSD